MQNVSLGTGKQRETVGSCDHGAAHTTQRRTVEATTLTWLAIKPLTEQLCCSERTIYALKESGLLEAGKHFYAVGGGTMRGRHVYALEPIRQVLLAETAKAMESRLREAPETYDDRHLRALTTQGTPFRVEQA